MKLFTALVVFSLLSVAAMAQQIPNGDFENWTTVNAYEEPQGYYSTNLSSWFFADTLVVQKSTSAHHGLYSAFMQTVAIPNDTIFGLLTNGIMSDGGFEGGVPFTAHPDTLSLALKYHLQGTDSVLIAMIFKNSGTVLGIVFKALGGNRSTFAEEHLPVQWVVPMLNPDTMLFVIVSSDPDRQPEPGSKVWVDDVKLDGNLIPNGGFESWSMRNYENPESWNTFNLFSLLGNPEYVSKSTDAYSGTYAMQIRTSIINNGKDTLAHVANGRLTTGDYWGGMPVSYNVAKVSGYYKYSPVGNDKALVALRAFGYTPSGVYDNIDNNIIQLYAANTYSYFEIPLNYNSWPPMDTLGIGFASSNIFSGQSDVHDGSLLLIDSLTLILRPMGLATPAEEDNSALLYPNPASDFVSLRLHALRPEARIIFYNSNGQVVMTRTAGQGKINIATLAPGLYFYRLENGQEYHTGKLRIVR